MSRNNKNYLIVGLFAIMIMMVVGYAAFSSTLTIGSSASVSSTWNVGFDTTKTSGTTVIKPTTGAGGTTAPSGTVSYGSNGQKATISASLHQPGDSVLFTLTIQNTGSIAATLGSATLSDASGCTISSLTCTSSNGNIKFTVTNPASTSLAASSGTTTMTVKAEYVNKSGGNTYNATETASVSVNITATQA